MILKLRVLLVIFLLKGTLSFTQDLSVEKSIFGAQIGLLGVWVHNEFRMSNELAFRTELGFDSGIWYQDGGYYSNYGFVMAPVISVEPRWYYNMKKREGKEKRLDGNAFNFLSLWISYHPDWFVFSNEDVDLVSDISFIPSWGIRRNLGKHFNFETGAGIGYRYVFSKDSGFEDDYDEIVINMMFKIGYKFKTKK